MRPLLSAGIAVRLADGLSFLQPVLADIFSTPIYPLEGCEMTISTFRANCIIRHQNRNYPLQSGMLEAAVSTAAFAIGCSSSMSDAILA
jgi:hypothetical protein